MNSNFSTNVFTDSYHLALKAAAQRQSQLEANNNAKNSSFLSIPTFMITRKSDYITMLIVIALAVTQLISQAVAFTPEVATTEVLPSHEDKQWFWVSGIRAPNMVDGRAFLFNREGKHLGQLNTGFWFNSLATPKTREEIITVETYFSRGTRGERTDLVTLYDAKTLSPKSEIPIPAKRMNSVKNTGLVTLTEDEKILLIVNYTPAQSVSVVNLATNRFVEEIETPGCSVLYPAGNRDFYSICGNGGFMHIQLDADGHLIALNRTEKLFDPVNDFLTIAASRAGNTWYFVSKQNNVYGIYMNRSEIELKSKWSLLTDDERDDDWLISGMHHTAIHELSQQLYVIMHKGKPETFEEPGTDVWVYDLKTQKKVREISMKDMTMSIAVDQSAEPRLLTLDVFIPMNIVFTAWTFLTEGKWELIKILQQRVNIYDASTGEHLHVTDSLPSGIVFNIQSW